MRYIKGASIAEDLWLHVAGEDAVPADVPAIVCAERLINGHVSLQGRGAPLGVAWPNTKPVAALASFLPHLELVALIFPTFRDGRAYTQARQLRDEHGFNGEIRATGDVLRDQFLFMARAGFDAYEVRKDADAEAFAKALTEFSVVYQPSAATSPSAFRAHMRRPGSAMQKDLLHV